MRDAIDRLTRKAFSKRLSVFVVYDGLNGIWKYEQLSGPQRCSLTAYSPEELWAKVQEWDPETLDDLESIV